MDENKLDSKLNLNPIKKPEWNVYKSDLPSLRLSKQELAKKLASRQSHNLALARAELIDKQKFKTNAKTFSPSHSTKLRSSANKSIDEVIAEADAALILAEESSPIMPRRTYSSLSNLPPNSPYSNPDVRPDYTHLSSPHAPSYATEGCQFGAQGIKESSVVPKKIEPSLAKDSLDPYPLTPQGWANLGGTIQLVVKTCEALWQQLEEERYRRENLHDQLQEQRRIIATLRAELMQIQEDQVSVMQELHAARAYDTSFMRRGIDPLHGPPLPPRGHPRSLAFSDTSLDTNELSRRYFSTAVPDISPRGRNAYQPMPRMHRGLSYGGKAKSASQIDLHEAASLYGDHYSTPIFQNFGYR